LTTRIIKRTNELLLKKVTTPKAFDKKVLLPNIQNVQTK